VWLKLGVPVEGFNHVLHVIKTSRTKSVHVAQVVWLRGASGTTVQNPCIWQKVLESTNSLASLSSSTCSLHRANEHHFLSVHGYHGRRCVVMQYLEHEAVNASVSRLESPGLLLFLKTTIPMLTHKQADAMQWSMTSNQQQQACDQTSCSALGQCWSDPKSQYP